jgi:hypothetical protein
MKNKSKAGKLPLYKGGAKIKKTGKIKVKKRQNVTVTIDALVLYFPVVYQFEDDLISNQIQLTDYKYTIHKPIGKNPYACFAKVYFKELFLGNLFIKKKSKSIYASANYNTFQVAKERFYAGDDWIKLVEDLFNKLAIKFKIHRLDIALDSDKNLLKLFSKYLEEKWGIVGKSKEPSYSNDPRTKSLANVRYTIDEGKKFIVLYNKNFGSKKQSSEENQAANARYKRIQKYQTEYWQKNGLKNIHTISRLEIRLFTKYVKIKRLEELKNKELLLSVIRKNVGENLTFKKGIIRNKIIDFDNLKVNNKVISVAEHIEFELAANEKTFLKNWYRSKSVKLIAQVSGNSGIVDLGDGLQAEVDRNLDDETKRFCPFRRIKELFTDMEFERKRPEKLMTKEQVKFMEAIKGITSAEWIRIEKERNDLDRLSNPQKE